MTDFSVVVPIKDAVDLISTTLPSYYAVGPSEVVLCFDDPVGDDGSLELARHVASRYPVDTKFVFVKRDLSWVFHQANVRREGFKAASSDRILTGDIDLVVNRNVLRAVELVGENGVGLASLSKLERGPKMKGLARFFGKAVLKSFVHKAAEAYRGYGIATTNFTGLYCFWRPYWLETEDDGIKQLHNPKESIWERVRGEWSAEDFYATGEDTYLRDCMERRYRVVYLPDVGGTVLRVELESNPTVQFSNGVYFALKGRNLLGALTRTVLRLEPNYICGHLYGRKLLRMRHGKKR